MFDIDLNQFLHDVVSDDFMLVTVVTYFVCEAVFRAMPDYGDRFKQIGALTVGGILGFLFIPHEQYLYSIVHGILAGGAATTIVARFKKPSEKKIVEAMSKKTLVDHPTV